MVVMLEIKPQGIGGVTTRLVVAGFDVLGFRFFSLLLPDDCLCEGIQRGLSGGLEREMIFYLFDIELKFCASSFSRWLVLRRGRREGKGQGEGGRKRVGCGYGVRVGK